MRNCRPRLRASGNDFRDPRLALSPGQVEALKLAGRAAVLNSKAGQANYLAKVLQKVWLFYDEQNVPLARPLGQSTLPDPVTKWHEKQLWVFRVEYRSHIGAVEYHLKEYEADFHSDVMDHPEQWNIHYHDLLGKLREHSAALRKLADEYYASAKKILLRSADSA
jgi:hypothetical protein